MKCFPSTQHQRNLKTQQSAVMLDLCFRKTPAAKLSFSKCFPSKLKREADVFKFLWFEGRFRKAPFSIRVSVEGKPNRRNKNAFSNFFDALRPTNAFSQIL